jgi:hypothetical protein
MKVIDNRSINILEPVRFYIHIDTIDEKCSVIRMKSNKLIAARFSYEHDIDVHTYVKRTIVQYDLEHDE